MMIVSTVANGYSLTDADLKCYKAMKARKSPQMGRWLEKFILT